VINITFIIHFSDKHRKNIGWEIINEVSLYQKNELIHADGHGDGILFVCGHFS